MLSEWGGDARPFLSTEGFESGFLPQLPPLRQFASEFFLLQTQQKCSRVNVDGIAPVSCPFCYQFSLLAFFDKRFFFSASFLLIT